MPFFRKISVFFLLLGFLSPHAFAGPVALGVPVSAQVEADGQSYPRVELFTTSWCGYCKRAKAFLSARGVPFTEYDVERDPAAARRFRTLNPGGGVPVALIGNRQINGFSPLDYQEALELKK